MNDVLTRHDDLLAEKGPSALVLREYLVPVEGPDGVLFPATFAASEDKTFKGGYNIDAFPDGTSICLVDSVGSQANRIEPLFAKTDYRALVPQITIVAGTKRISLLDAGHRAGDAIIRCSALQEELRAAFKAVQAGNAEPLAKLAPTSLVFGVWDSRDTQAKLPRLVASTIRAFNVRKLTRSAQFVPVTDYTGEGLLEATDDKKQKDAYAERGFIHVPASGSHGGVIADGGTRRDAALHLSALRLCRGETQETTLPLLRYILGLALTALTYPPAGYLRQGCNLVLDPTKKREFALVHSDGHRDELALTHEDCLAYAKATARAFNKSSDREVEFDKALAKKDVSGDAHEEKKKSTKSAGKNAK